MKKNYFIISIVAFVLFSLPLSLCAMEYQHKLEVKIMQFSWTIEGDLIHVLLQAKTTGWVAIGFDPENAMQGANIIIGAVKDGKVDIIKECKLHGPVKLKILEMLNEKEYYVGKHDIMELTGLGEYDVMLVADEMEYCGLAKRVEGTYPSFTLKITHEGKEYLAANKK